MKERKTGKDELTKDCLKGEKEEMTLKKWKGRN